MSAALLARDDNDRITATAEENGTPIPTCFLYDGKDIVNEEVEGDITATYRYGQGLIRQWDGSGDSYPMFDARGNLRLVLDEDEEVIAGCAPEGTGSDLPVIGATAMGNRMCTLRQAQRDGRRCSGYAPFATRIV